jgi:hypothetical protein
MTEQFSEVRPTGRTRSGAAINDFLQAGFVALTRKAKELDR